MLLGGGYTGAYGEFRQVRSYGRCLPQTEIGFNYNLISAPYSRVGLMSEYRLDEGGGVELNNTGGTTLSGLVTDGIEEWITVSGDVLPDHKFATLYAYNSLNQVVKQSSPDGGSSQFWYDRLGRLVISQNEEQATGTASPRFSYTRYDALGRVIEVGEKEYPSVTPGEDSDDLNVLDANAVEHWMNTDGTNRQITVTRYSNADNDDAPDGHVLLPPTAILSKQQNLRNRVAASYYIEDAGLTQLYASYYSYDIAGNVFKLWQELVPMREYDGSGIKEMQYDYDLISGKVNSVWYQYGKKDQYFYMYRYDAENRLKEALSGRSNFASHLKLDASYSYYLHGPLARTEIGAANKKLQGIDYAYTLQGWLKGVNSSLLDPAKDMGLDGHSSGIHQNFGKDVFSYVLNYFAETRDGVLFKDYVPSGATAGASFLNFGFNDNSFATGRPLFNGNISAISLALYKLHNKTTTGYSYGYDQLNRLVNMKKHWDDITNGNSTATVWDKNSVHTDEPYSERYTYDGAGNIQTLVRKGAGTANNPLAMDNLSYKYYYVDNADNLQEYDPANPPATGVKYFTNRLARVRDNVPAGNYSIDIDEQAAGNYSYDRIGNLISDQAEGLTNVTWNVYGKIKSIAKTKNGVSTTMTYQYDASGNRVMKQVGNKVTFYIRDAQGNVMGLYDAMKDPAASTQAGYTWQEQHLYGSSRLGMFTPRDYIAHWQVSTAPPTTADPAGKRIYELSNHLGNVHVTISDILRQEGVDGKFVPEIVSTSDYYPFGMLMPERHGFKYGEGWAGGTDDVNGNNVPQKLSVHERSAAVTEYKASKEIEFLPGFGEEALAVDEFVAYIADGTNTAAGNPKGSGGENNGYRYGFNGKENDNEVKGEGNQVDLGSRVLDTRLGRFFATDPDESKYPYQSTYVLAGNKPVLLIDIDGRGVNSTIVDKDGKVVGGKIDGDKGVYKVDNVTKDNFDVSKMDQYKKDGTLLGRTISEYSFVEPKTGQWMGKVNLNFNARDDLAKVTRSFGRFMLTHSNIESFNEYKNNAGNGGRYDVKSWGIDWDKASEAEKLQHVYQASFAGDGIIMTRRDMGNYFAGRAAKMMGLPESFYLSGFGAFQSNANKGGAMFYFKSFVNWIDHVTLSEAIRSTPIQGKMNIRPVFSDDKVSEDLQRAGYNQYQR